MDATKWWEDFYYYATHDLTATTGPGRMVPDEDKAGVIRAALARLAEDIQQESGCMIQDKP